MKQLLKLAHYFDHKLAAKKFHPFHIAVLWGDPNQEFPEDRYDDGHAYRFSPEDSVKYAFEQNEQYGNAGVEIKFFKEGKWKPYSKDLLLCGDYPSQEDMIKDVKQSIINHLE